MISISIVAIKCLVAILLGVFEGNGAVFFFNKMPAKWFCDYGEEPTEEMLDPYTQRIKSHPWKYIFTMLFIVLNIKLAIDDIQFAVAASLALWLLLELSIGDIKYRILPEQIIVLLAITGLGFIPYQGSWQRCLIGAAIGFGIMFFTAFLGRLTYKRATLGGGDIKLFAALGVVAGPDGIIAIFVMTALISAGHFIFLIASKKIKKTDILPMCPYITIATAIYLVFLWGRLDTLLI